MSAAWVPGLWEETVPGVFGLRMTDDGRDWWQLALYAWPLLAMLLAPLVRACDGVRGLRLLSVPLLYVIGFGPVLCAITLDAYVKQWRGASAAWDKTEKTGRVVG